MRLDEKLVGQITDRQHLLRRRTNRQQALVLVWSHSERLRRLRAEIEKATKLIAESRKCFVIGLAYRPTFVRIVNHLMFPNGVSINDVGGSASSVSIRAGHR